MCDEDVAGVAAFLPALHAFDPGGAPVGRPDWLLRGHPGGPEILAAYAGRVDETFAGRALFYRRLAPWFEAAYGLVVGRRASVEKGLAGIRARLP